LWTWRVAGTVDSHRLMSLRFLARTRRAKTVAVATIVDYLGGLALPDRAADGRLFPAVDVTCWLRPDAHTAPERILRHTYGRGKDQHIMIPGWPYSFVVALQTGRSSRTAPLDAVRLAPADDGYPPRTPDASGRPRRHGTEFIFGDPASWGAPDVATTADTRLHGQARARAWDRLHPRLTRCAAFRMLKPTFGWTCPKIRTPHAVDRWTG
jgi:hypothetical protein